MARCTNCDYKWNVKEIWSLGWSKNGKACPNCGNRQYISGETQNMFTLGFISVAFIIIFPFFIKLSGKNEDLFQ